MGAVSTGISVVAEDPQGCSPVSVRLAGCGFSCRTTSDSQRPRPLLADRQFDVLITGIGMPQVNGLDLLIHAKRHALGCSVSPPKQFSHPPQLNAPRSRNNLIRGKSGGEFLPQVLTDFDRGTVPPRSSIRRSRPWQPSGAPHTHTD